MKPLRKALNLKSPAVRSGLFCALTLGLAGCGAAQRAELSELSAGKRAAAEAQAPGSKAPLPCGDVLDCMKEAMEAHEKGAWAASNQAVERALRHVDGQPVISVGKTLGSAVINEKRHDYKGDPHELVLLHTLAMLNFSFLGQTEEALVEVRAANSLMMELAASGRKYPEDPLNRYFSAKLYERAGLWDDAYIDLKRARQAFQDLEPLSKVPEPSFLAGDLKRLAKKAGRKDELRLLNQEDARPATVLGPGQGELWILVFEDKTFDEPKAPVRDWREDPPLLPMEDAAFKRNMTAKLGLAESPIELVYQPALMAQEAAKSKSFGENVRSATRFGVRLALLVGLAMLVHADLPDSALKLIPEDDSQARRWDNVPARVYACRLLVPAGKAELRLSGEAEGGETWVEKINLRVPKGRSGLVRLNINDQERTLALSPSLRP